jgi:prepilin-type N-terminal cleavage/methylation domain-containing protein
MGTSVSHHKPKRQRGFTLIERLAAILVLTIGLVGMAVLMSNMMTGGARSRHMSEAAMLASEKLEDLERYPALDPDVASFLEDGALERSAFPPPGCRSFFCLHPTTEPSGLAVRSL